MANEAATAQVARVDSQIHLIRGQRVMLDCDLAAINGVPTMRLNEQVKGNQQRFPGDFSFQRTRDEFQNLRSQFAISKKVHMQETSSPYRVSRIR